MVTPFTSRRRKVAVRSALPIQTTARDLRAELDDAADLVDHPIAAVRLAGLLGLVRLADAHPGIRQPVVSVLGAYLRRYPVGSGPDRSEAVVHRAVLDAVREHLLDADDPATWCGLEIDLTGCELAGDLSGILVTAGAVRLDRVRVPVGGMLDLRGARVSGGTLSMDRMRVAGRLDASGLLVTGGEASLDRLVVAGGTVLLDDARLSDGSVWLRDGAVDDGGTLSLRGLRLSGGRVSLHDTHVRGEVRLDDAHLDGGSLHLSGATVESGEVRLDDLRLDAGVLSLTLTAVRGGLLSLDGAQLGDAGAVRMHGLTVEDAASVVWGPLTPVEPAPAAAAGVVHDLDLRGPATDPWSVSDEAAGGWLAGAS
jgi:hypothetical protein